MAAPALDWSSAQVRDGVLTVGLTGERPKGWKKGFRHTVRRLGRDEWGELTLRRGAIRVGGPVPGEEERLRHALEAIVEQVNASHPAPPDDAPTGTETERSDADPDPDADMTARFRAFGGRASA